MNYSKKGLKRLLDMILRKQLCRLVPSHKDRLLRFGAELVFTLCEQQGIEVVIINQGEPPFEEELAQDVLEIITVFSARLYGARSHQHKKTMDALQELAHKIELYPNGTGTLSASVHGCPTLCLQRAHFSQKGVKWSKHEAYRVFMTKVRQPWMADVTSRAPRNAIDDLHRAYEGFFRRVKAGKRPYGYPKFQKRGQHDRFALREKPKFRVDGRRLRLEKAPV